MMTLENYNDAAISLRRAYGAKPISPLRGRLVENTPDAGYRVQDINTAYWLSQGRELVGRKIGLTSASVQEQVGVDQPDFGMLFVDMQVANGGEISSRRLMQPRAEGELIFHIAHDLVSDELNESDVADAISWGAAAIEIVDSRVAGWDVKIVDTVADNASTGLFIMGDDRIPLHDIDLTGCEMTLTENGRAVSNGTGVACLGSPLIATTWLARKMVEVGRPLRQGDLVLSGALGPLVPLSIGCAYEVEVSGIGTASFKMTD